MSGKTALIGDIGGTNARFAIATLSRKSGIGFHDAVTLQCAEYPSPEAAIRAYLDGAGAALPDTVCLAAAGPVVDDTVKLTNNHWRLCAGDIAAELAVKNVRLLNDFEAVAWSIPGLSADDFETIGLPDGDATLADEYSIAIIGPGTGLGAAGLRRRQGITVPIVGEGGHVGFAPQTQVQIDVLQALRERYDRVFAERLLSGAGIANIYWAINRLHGDKRVQLTAAEIFKAAEDDNEQHAVESVNLFFEILGQVAGDLVLTLGASDGVYIAGGIAKRYPKLLHGSGFRSAFENKGSHRALMERVPVRLITHAEPGLLGAAYCALQSGS